MYENPYRAGSTGEYRTGATLVRGDRINPVHKDAPLFEDLGVFRIECRESRKSKWLGRSQRDRRESGLGSALRFQVLGDFFEALAISDGHLKRHVDQFITG